jgi:tetratricopeptide (TPR) repeat protein
MVPLVGHRAAIRLLDYATTLDRQAAYAYNMKGYFWNQLSEEPPAIDAVINALDIDNTNVPGLNNLAVIYFNNSLNDQAVSLQQRASEAAPNEAIVKYNLGLMLMEGHDYQSAIRMLREATYIVPHWAFPYIHLSSIYLLTGDYAEAEEAARTATHLAPAQKSAHLTLAFALYEQDEKPEALSSFTRAAEIDPEDVVARFYQALILRDLGDYRQALRYLHQVLELCSDPGQRSRIAMEVDTIQRMEQAASYDTQ